MSFITPVNETSLADLLKTSPLPVLVDFGATWCGPCKMLDPFVEKMAEAWQGKITVVKLDVDDCPFAAEQNQVMGVPTLILFKAGKPVDRTSGFQPYEKLVERFSQYL